MRREKNQYIFASELTKRNRSHHFRVAFLVFLPLLILILCVMSIAISRQVIVRDLKLTILNLPADLENYSILHISDLHGARFGKEQKAIATALGDTRYSCVVMTGDMLGEDRDVEPLLELIALMPRDVPKFLIAGDMDGDIVETTAHSSLSVYAQWVEEVQAQGVKVLDCPALITREKGRIWFVPEELYALNLDGMLNTYRDQWTNLNSRAASLTANDAARLRYLEYELQRLEDLKEIKKQIKPEDIQVVLTHTPLSSDYMADLVSWGNKEEAFSMRYASLILAGHYNGGQWRIPFAGALYVPELGWFPEDELVEGLSYIEGIPQYISPGMGSDPHYEHQPGRIFNSPVITRILLTRKVN